MATFLLGGLWHGAGWTFVVWGGLHGAALVIFRWWRNAGFRLHRVPAILLTFAFVHFTWVFFRAPSLGDALRMLGKLVPDNLRLNAAQFNLWPSPASIGLPYASPSAGMLLLAAACLILLPRNSDYLTNNFAARKRDCVWAATLLTLGTLTLGQVTQFLYFNF
jgi:hypothetical protein